MAEIATFRCDECGKLKEEANHWYRAIRWMRSIEGKPEEPAFTIVTWGQKLECPGERQLHLCGMNCAVKAMTKAVEAS